MAEKALAEAAGEASPVVWGEEGECTRWEAGNNEAFGVPNGGLDAPIRDIRKEGNVTHRGSS